MDRLTDDELDGMAEGAAEHLCDQHFNENLPVELEDFLRKVYAEVTTQKTCIGCILVREVKKLGGGS